MCVKDPPTWGGPLLFENEKRKKKETKEREKGKEERTRERKEEEKKGSFTSLKR